MKLVADEGIDAPIVQALREDGHEVSYVAELEPGLDDDAVLALATARDAVLLTGDKDFGELVFRQRRDASGIVLIRLAGLPSSSKARLVVVAIRDHGSELPGSFCVVRPDSVRIRSVQPPTVG